MGEEGPKASLGGLIFSLPLLGVGGAGVAQGFGLCQCLGKPLVPLWVIGLAGLVFLLGGLGIAARSLGAGGGAGSFLGTVVFLCLGAVFNYSVFGGDLRSWSGPALGPFLSAGELVRILVVAADIFVLICLPDYALGKLRGVESPIIERVESLTGEGQKAFAVAFLAAPFVIAILLHATGGLDWIGRRFGQPQRGVEQRELVLSAGALLVQRNPQGLERPLAEFAGVWRSSSMFGSGWVTLAEVRVDGGKASATLWRACPPVECTTGRADALIEARTPGHAHALHFSGRTGGMDWVYSLRAQTGGSGILVEERHIRGRDWNTHQQTTTGAQRGP